MSTRSKTLGTEFRQVVPPTSVQRVRPRSGEVVDGLEPLA